MGHDDIDALEERAHRGVAESMRALAARRDYAEACAAIEALAAACLPALMERGAFASTRRVRVWLADALLTAAMETEQPLDHCECRLARRLALVYNDLYDKSLQLGAFCGHAIRAGDPARALIYLDPLVEELEAEHARTGDATIAHCLESSRCVLERAHDALAREESG